MTSKRSYRFYPFMLAVISRNLRIMKPDQIQVGCFYVGDRSEYLVREVISKVDAENILWRDYHIETGEPISKSQNLCSRRAMADWAKREATADEIVRMQRIKAIQDEQYTALARIRVALQEASNEMLIAELQRRLQRSG